MDLITSNSIPRLLLAHLIGLYRQPHGEKRSTPNGIPIGLQSDGILQPDYRFMLSKYGPFLQQLRGRTNPEKVLYKTLKEFIAERPFHDFGLGLRFSFNWIIFYKNTGMS
ncbi:MAG: hypothetical protein R3B93_22125 [Bacteroidia bacterium]